MPFCPKCRAEYERWVEVCADDGERLVETLPEEQPASEAMVDQFPEDEGELVAAWVTESYEYAGMIAEFLEEQGIAATIFNEASANMLHHREARAMSIMVTEKNVENARQMIEEFFSVEAGDASMEEPGADDTPDHSVEPEPADTTSQAGDKRAPEIRPKVVEGSVKKVVVGAATFYLLFYLMVMGALMIYVRGDLGIFSHFTKPTLPLHFLTIGMAVFLSIYYFWHYHTNDRIPAGSRSTWRVAFFLFSFWNEPDQDPNQRLR